MEHPPVPSKNWELSLYELHRTPQEAITDSTEIAVSPRSLHSELMCPICLDMLKSTMTTKECLHRFCQECIITALRSGNKECPTCRKKLVSKRSLRPDPNFDALISKIYPSRDEYEAHQERVLQKLKQHHNTNAFSHSIEEGLRLQALNRAQRVRKQAGDGQPGEPQTPPIGDEPNGKMEAMMGPENTPKKRSRAVSEDSGTSMGDSVEGHDSEMPKPEPPRDIELIFKPHPDDDKDESGAMTRYIKTTANASGTKCRFSYINVIVIFIFQLTVKCI